MKSVGALTAPRYSTFAQSIFCAIPTVAASMPAAKDHSATANIKSIKASVPGALLRRESNNAIPTEMNAVM